MNDKLKAIVTSESFHAGWTAAVLFLAEYIQTGNKLSLGGVLAGMALAVIQAIRKANTVSSV